MTKRTSKKEEGNKFLPSRKDYNYTTVIDKFEKYAFTYYFAYELAVRNNYVAKSLNLLKDLFDLYLVLDEINRRSSLTAINIEKAVKKIFCIISAFEINGMLKYAVLLFALIERCT